MKNLMSEKAQAVIVKLLKVLPDSIHDHDASWGYCWNELSDDAQEQVKAAGREAAWFLEGETEDASGWIAVEERMTETKKNVM